MSRRIREEMIGAGVPAERVALIAHGVDTGRFRPADADEARALRAKLGLPAGTLAVYTGRLLRGKGLELLLEAFASVAAELPDLRLVLVGSGAGQSLSVEDELRRRAAEASLARPRGVRRPRRRGGGLAARVGPLRVPVAVRGPRHLARGGRRRAACRRSAAGRAGSWT